MKSPIATPVMAKKDVDTIIYSGNKLSGAGHVIIDKNNNVICALLTKDNADFLVNAIDNAGKMEETIRELLDIFNYFYENGTYMGGNEKVDAVLQKADFAVRASFMSKQKGK